MSEKKWKKRDVHEGENEDEVVRVEEEEQQQQEVRMKKGLHCKLFTCCCFWCSK